MRSGFLHYPYLGLIATLVTESSAQDLSIIPKIQHSTGYEQFVLRIVEKDVKTRKFFEAWDSPVPDIAGKEVVSRWILSVKGNKARTDFVIGEGPRSTPYVQIFDGKKTLDFYVKGEDSAGKQLMRASEDDKNMLKGNFWRALQRDSDLLKYWWETPSRVEGVTRRSGEILIFEGGRGKTTVRYNAKPPFEYVGQSHTNAAGKIATEEIVTKTFSDVFPREIRQTISVMGERVGWTTYVVAERRSEPIDDAIFRVSPAAGSFILGTTKVGSIKSGRMGHEPNTHRSALESRSAPPIASTCS